MSNTQRAIGLALFGLALSILGASATVYLVPSTLERLPQSTVDLIQNFKPVHKLLLVGLAFAMAGASFALLKLNSRKLRTFHLPPHAVN